MPRLPAPMYSLLPLQLPLAQDSCISSIPFLASRPSFSTFPGAWFLIPPLTCTRLPSCIFPLPSMNPPFRPPELIHRHQQPRMPPSHYPPQPCNQISLSSLHIPSLQPQPPPLHQKRVGNSPPTPHPQPPNHHQQDRIQSHTTQQPARIETRATVDRYRVVARVGAGFEVVVVVVLPVGEFGGGGEDGVV